MNISRYLATRRVPVVSCSPQDHRHRRIISIEKEKIMFLHLPTTPEPSGCCTENLLVSPQFLPCPPVLLPLVFLYFPSCGRLTGALVPGFGEDYRQEGSVCPAAPTARLV